MAQDAQDWLGANKFAVFLMQMDSCQPLEAGIYVFLLLTQVSRFFNLQVYLRLYSVDIKTTYWKDSFLTKSPSLMVPTLFLYKKMQITISLFMQCARKDDYSLLEFQDFPIAIEQFQR